MSQGANPWSDLGSREALRLLGQYLERAVTDADDREAREQTMWAATLAGIAFGNAGVHVPHAMAYAVAGQVRDFHPDGYPGSEAMVPHGMAVILNAPSVFRHTAATEPASATWKRRGTWAPTSRDAGPEDAGEVLADDLIRIMRAVGMPNGLSAVGYTEADCGSAGRRRLAAAAPAAERAAGHDKAVLDEACFARRSATGSRSAHRRRATATSCPSPRGGWTTTSTATSTTSRTTATSTRWRTTS